MNFEQTVVYYKKKEPAFYFTPNARQFVNTMVSQRSVLGRNKRMHS